ncbi:thermonuclease family protein [Nocardioides sp.]|uniref:thermonuclease family protein n=1 Tax=Nocardioides sp. TaxID=35761 RepID=UPI00286D0688|nr:thermonuclease family protein [Nocardioides sp.]
MQRISHYLGALLIALTGALVFSAGVPAAHAVADRDCGDFNTQKAAQDFYINAGGPQSDPHGLDDDGDGVACESNPCPCSTSQGGGGQQPGGGSQPEPTRRQKAKIVRVIDGDTYEVKLIGGPKRTVRVLGIDTPEVFGGKECGGPAASKAAKKMLPVGTRVLLISDNTQDLKDRYGRILRYVIKGKIDVGRNQLNQGHAKVFVFDKPFKRVDSYRAAQRKAKQADKGIWGNC